VTKTPPRRPHPQAPATTPPPAFGEFCSCWGSCSWVANLRPARAPDQTAARNGKVNAQLYTSVIGFLHDKVCLKSSSSAGAFTERTSPARCQRRSVNDTPYRPHRLKMLNT
jgi:hypothetical protein